MNYKVLYRKYRPLTFDEVTGQQTVVRTLKNAILNNKISHAYIFTGPRGTGKTSLAKIFARSINCHNLQNGNPCLECEACQNFNDNPDIIEIDAASNNGVDEIRELINNIKLAPSNSKYKVYIIDEVHMLSQSAFNALLLTLEEPPAHVIFILATTDIQNVPITILSRTQRFDFSRISNQDIENRLAYVCSQEKIKIEKEAIKEIASLAEGGMRDALSILDQLSSITTKIISLDDVIANCGTIANQKLEDFFIKIDDNKVEEVINDLNNFKTSSIDSKVFISKLLNILKDKAIDIKLGKIEEKRLSFDDIKAIILELNDMLVNKMIGIDPYIIIEMIIISYMETKEKPIIESKNGKKEENNFPGNKIDDKLELKKEVNQLVEKQPKIQNNDLLTKFKNIRINNCLAEANKKELEKVKKSWKEFVNKIQNIDNNIYLSISDTKIIVSSTTYFMIETLTESSAALINKQTEIIENLYNKEYNLKYKIIAVDKGEWQKVKKQYIENINNHHKYQMQEEIKLKKEEDSENDDLTMNIFDTAKIEIIKE